MNNQTKEIKDSKLELNNVKNTAKNAIKNVRIAAPFVEVGQEVLWICVFKFL